MGNLSAPSNSPPQVPISLSPGQGLSILAAGQIGGLPPEGGGRGVAATTNKTAGGVGGTGAFGLSDAIVLQNALIGVFVGDTIDSTHTPVSVGGDIENVQTIYPLLQQVFYVGNGMTPLGQTRVIVVPAGATRLFLASAAGGFNSSGSFIASVSSATIPPVTSSTNPITVASSADLYFADQPNGTGVVASNGFASALAPYSTPIRVPLSLTPGQTLHIRSSALGPGLGLSQVPFGLAADSPTADAFGLSGIRL